MGATDFDRQLTLGGTQAAFPGGFFPHSTEISELGQRSCDSCRIYINDEAEVGKGGDV